MAPLRAIGDRAAFRLVEHVGIGTWLGTDAAGQEAVVFEMDRTGASTPRRLRHLSYEPPAPMRLWWEGVDRTISAAVLVCRSPEPMLRAHFMPLARALCTFGDEPPTEVHVEDRLDALVELLSALILPPKRTAQGLWAELAMIAWARDAATAAEAWHRDPYALHDFANAGLFLEVKSTLDARRQHAVSLDQLDRGQGQRIVLASLMLEESDSGVSVGEMMALVLGRLEGTPALKRKVTATVCRSLGRELDSGTAVRIEPGQARSKLRYYDAASVPCVASPVPDAVTDVRFRVDLTAVQPLTIIELQSAHGWWASMLPPG